MRKIGVIATCATCAAMAWGLATVKPTESEPGIKPVEKIQRSWSIPAEDSEIYQNAKVSMREWCDEEGKGSKVWIERNKTGRLEVLGRCLGS
jgi:hypothetical protein